MLLNGKWEERSEHTKKLLSAKLSTFDQKSNYLVCTKTFVAGNVTFIMLRKKTLLLKVISLAIKYKVNPGSTFVMILKTLSFFLVESWIS